MKTINSILKDGLDIYHLKIEDKKHLKNDYVEKNIFEKQINVPISVFEDKFQTIIVNKMLHRVLLFADIEVKQAFEKYGIFGRYNISFAGEYNDEMKNEIEEYVINNGLSKMERKTKIKNNDCSIIGTIEFYGTVTTTGFYYSRQGLLRGNVAEKHRNIMSKKYSGNLNDAEDIKTHLELDYPQYIFGENGKQKLLDYYQKNFIDNFEFGKSFLMVH